MLLSMPVLIVIIILIVFFFGLVSYTTELLEIHADDPKLHVLFIPGNPGKFGFILFCI